MTDQSFEVLLFRAFLKASDLLKPKAKIKFRESNEGRNLFRFMALACFPDGNGSVDVDALMSHVRAYCEKNGIKIKEAAE